ncbi:MAG: hypothetical protein UIC45_02705, partial [Paludibacteraceae bacterium]|nr:hypothetical protein [Paludibacteraceae bacterium]
MSIHKVTYYIISKQEIYPQFICLIYFLENIEKKRLNRLQIQKISVSLQYKDINEAIHNKDYSVVKTFKAAGVKS